jgi:hypothetical protein
MSTLPNGGDEEPSPRLFGYSFGLLLLGLIGILVGVTIVGSVPATLGGALIATGYVLVYVGFLLGFYLDLRNPGTVRTERPLDGESG